MSNPPPVIVPIPEACTAEPGEPCTTSLCEYSCDACGIHVPPGEEVGREGEWRCTDCPETLIAPASAGVPGAPFVFPSECGACAGTGLCLDGSGDPCEFCTYFVEGQPCQTRDQVLAEVREWVEANAASDVQYAIDAFQITADELSAPVRDDQGRPTYPAVSPDLFDS